MTIDVVLLPEDLSATQASPAVVVFDVLRATTSMVAALAAGVEEIRVNPDIETARRAAGHFGTGALLCGEERCLTPSGFDLGNSPGAFSGVHAGRTLFMSTTNGTRAIIAARNAETLLVGALVNAAATAAALDGMAADAALVCAGTRGRIAMEDVIGAGAVIWELGQLRAITLGSDVARMAVRLFNEARSDLRGALAESRGGQDVIGAGLPGDIDFAARLNSIAVAAEVHADPLRVVRRHATVRV